jgi:hypothetical protein
VNRPGDNPPACAALSAHQHTCTQRRRKSDARAHVAHRGRQAVQIVAATARRQETAALALRALAFERVDQARRPERPGKYVRAARRHGVARQVRALHVDDGKHQRAGAAQTQVAGRPQRRSAPRQIQQDRHVRALQRAERAGRRVGPDHFERGGGQGAPGLEALLRWTTDVENLHFVEGAYAARVNG